MGGSGGQADSGVHFFVTNLLLQFVTLLSTLLFTAAILLRLGLRKNL
jgi:hypothetical protein